MLVHKIASFFGINYCMLLAEFELVVVKVGVEISTCMYLVYRTLVSDCPWLMVGTCRLIRTGPWIMTSSRIFSKSLAHGRWGTWLTLLLHLVNLFLSLVNYDNSSIQKMFARFDADRSGTLERQEVANAIRSLGMAWLNSLHLCGVT